MYVFETQNDRDKDNERNRKREAERQSERQEKERKRISSSFPKYHLEYLGLGRDITGVRTLIWVSHDFGRGPATLFVLFLPQGLNHEWDSGDKHWCHNAKLAL